MPCLHGRRHAGHDGGAQRSRWIRDQRDGAATGEAADRDLSSRERCRRRPDRGRRTDGHLLASFKNASHL